MFKNLTLPESFEDAWDIVTSSSRGELMLTASYKPGSKTVVIRMGNFRKIRVPLSWIEQRNTNVAVDPLRLSIRGFGQILVLGDADVDVEDILREFN